MPGSSAFLRVSWLVIALLAGVTPSASAQGKRPFADLGRYIRAGDTVFVVERTEGASAGVVTRVTPTELVVSVSGQERRLTESTVAWIERSPDPIWDGAAGGVGVALPWALYGLASGDPGALIILGGGAAIGAALDAAVKGKEVIYGKPPGFSFMRRPVPVSSLGDLWSRVPPGESIRVRDASVGERRGRFVKASREALTIEIDSGELVIPAERVRQVQRRSYVAGYWIWIGVALGGVVGVVKKHDPYNRHGTREDAGRGLLAGGLLGVVVSGPAARYTDVYRPEPSAGPDVAVRPVVGLGRRGVALSVKF
jgi:hypothetical protein